MVVQVAVEQMPVNDFLFWRFALAGALLAVANPRSLRRLDRVDLRRGAVLSVILAVSYVLQTVGLQYTAASVSGFITGMFLVFVPLISAVLLQRQRPGQRLAGGGARDRWTGPAEPARASPSGVGESLTLVCAFGFALHLVLLGEWSTPRDRLWPDGGAAGGGHRGDRRAASLSDARHRSPAHHRAVVDVGFMAVVATMLAFLVQTWAIPIVGSVRGAVILTGEPVFAGIFGVLVAGDEVTARTAAGALCILAAMLLVGVAPANCRDARGCAADRARTPCERPT